MRIELTESEKGTFFDGASAKISTDGAELLHTLAEELGKLPNRIAMEGHADSGSYGNWELSTDRANAARRLMVSSAIRDNQVTQVRGFADQRLRKKDDPMHTSNRRISLIVQYLEKSPGGASEGAGKEAGTAPESERVVESAKEPAKEQSKTNKQTVQLSVQGVARKSQGAARILYRR